MRVVLLTGLVLGAGAVLLPGSTASADANCSPAGAVRPGAARADGDPAEAAPAADEAAPAAAENAAPAPAESPVPEEVPASQEVPPWEAPAPAEATGEGDDGRIDSGEVAPGENPAAAGDPGDDEPSGENGADPAAEAMLDGAELSELSIEASSSPSTVTQGEVVTITIQVHNAGPDADPGVMVTEAIPEGAVLQSPVAGLNPASGMLDLGSIAVGETVTVEIAVVIPDASGGIVTTPSVVGEVSDGYSIDDQTCTMVQVVPSTSPGPSGDAQSDDGSQQPSQEPSGGGEQTGSADTPPGPRSDAQATAGAPQAPDGRRGGDRPQPPEPSASGSAGSAAPEAGTTGDVGGAGDRRVATEPLDGVMPTEPEDVLALVGVLMLVAGLALLAVSVQRQRQS